MKPDTGNSYHSLTDGAADAPAAQSTDNTILDSGLTASNHPWLHTPRSCHDGSVDYQHGLPDMQRQYFGESQCYPSSYIEQQDPRLVSFGVAQSAVSGRSGPFFTFGPYVPSYTPSSNNNLEKWQPIGSSNPPMPAYGLNTSVTNSRTSSARLLTTGDQDTFVPNDVDATSPIELESQTSQRSFGSSWCSCSTPQGLLHSHHATTPEVKTEPGSVEYLQNDSVRNSHSPNRRRSSEMPRPRVLLFIC